MEADLAGGGMKASFTLSSAFCAGTTECNVQPAATACFAASTASSNGLTCDCGVTVSKCAYKALSICGVKTYNKPVPAAITANGEAINADQK